MFEATQENWYIEIKIYSFMAFKKMLRRTF